MCAQQLHHLCLLGVRSGDGNRVRSLQGSGKLGLVGRAAVVGVSRSIVVFSGASRRDRGSRVRSGSASARVGGRGVSVVLLLVGVGGRLRGGLLLALLEDNFLSRSFGGHSDNTLLSGLAVGLHNSSIIVGGLGLGGNDHCTSLGGGRLGALLRSLRASRLYNSRASLVVLAGTGGLTTRTVSSRYKFRRMKGIALNVAKVWTLKVFLQEHEQPNAANLRTIRSTSGHFILLL